MFLDDDKAVLVAETFRLLGDASRLRILALCIEQPECVSAIAERLHLSQPLVSHHLRLLRAARVVRAQRSGKHVFYCAVDEHVRSVVRAMAEHLSEPDGEEPPPHAHDDKHSDGGLP